MLAPMMRTKQAPVLALMAHSIQTLKKATTKMNIIHLEEQQQIQRNRIFPQIAVQVAAATLAPASSIQVPRHCHRQSTKTSMCIMRNPSKKSITILASIWELVLPNRAPLEHQRCHYEGHLSPTLCQFIWPGSVVSFANCCDLAVAYVIYSRKTN